MALASPVGSLPGVHALRDHDALQDHHALRDHHGLQGLAACPLEDLARPPVAVFHRQAWSEPCALEHIAVAPCGVVVVGVADRRRQRVQTQVVGGMISPAHTELLVDGRVSDGLLTRVEAVAADVAELLREAGRGDLAVVPLLWLVGARTRSLGGRLNVGGTTVVGGSRIEHLLRRGPLDALARHRVRTLLAESLGAATGP